MINNRKFEVGVYEAALGACLGYLTAGRKPTLEQLRLMLLGSLIQREEFYL